MQDNSASGGASMRSDCFSEKQISSGEAKREFSQLKSAGGEELAQQKTLKSGRKLVWRSIHTDEDDDLLQDEGEQQQQQQQDQATKFSFKMGISRRIRGWNQKREEHVEPPSQVEADEKIVQEHFFYAVTRGDAFLTKMLHEEGASLEWTNADGMTPLMLVCAQPKLFNMVLTLLRMGANLKAYKSGPHGGYALHFAAVAGLTDTVALLLSYGADSLLANDDGQTPLDIARERKHVSVVRIIEEWLCLFGGFLREIHVNNTAESRKTTSKKIWVVVLPTCSNAPERNELVLYASKKAASPRTVIWLGNFTSEIQLPDFSSPNPHIVITDKVSKLKYRFRAEDKEQNAEVLEAFYKACTQGQRRESRVPSEAAQAEGSGDADLAMAIDASIQSGLREGIPLSQMLQPRKKVVVPPDPPPTASTSGSASTTLEKPCIVCMDAPLDAACVPCGHQVGCFDCLTMIQRETGTCPVCRLSVASIVKVLRV